MITIGIPTYKRPEPLIALLRQIANEQVIRDNCKVLVINDSGTEEDCQKYQSEFNLHFDIIDKLNFQYEKNDKNIGFPKSLIKLIEQSDTKYLLVMANDDFLIKDNFSEILAFLEVQKPDLCSPRWLSGDGRIGRGGESTRKVTLEEHRRCCGHVPGLILNLEKAREVLPFLQQRLEKGCAAALTYPSVILSIPLILANDNLWYFAGAIAQEGAACRSQIKDAVGNHYSDIASRIQQIAAFDDYILGFKQSEARDRILQESRAWSIAKAIGSDPHLKDYIRHRFERGPLIARLARGAKRYFLHRLSATRKQKGTRK